MPTRLDADFAALPSETRAPATLYFEPAANRIRTEQPGMEADEGLNPALASIEEGAVLYEERAPAAPSR